jgi:hypothetical protein
MGAHRAALRANLDQADRVIADESGGKLRIVTGSSRAA